MARIASGQSGQIRAEALAVEEFVALAHGLRERFGLLRRPLSDPVEKPEYKQDDDDRDGGLEQEQEQE